MNKRQPERQTHNIYVIHLITPQAAARQPEPGTIGEDAVSSFAAEGRKTSPAW